MAVMERTTSQRSRLLLFGSTCAVLIIRVAQSGTAFSVPPTAPQVSADIFRHGVTDVGGGTAMTSFTGRGLRRVKPTAIAAGGTTASMSIGGARVETMLTAIVAGASVFALCAFGQITTRLYGLPMWGPPLGAISLIFASESTAAAQKGEAFVPSAILKRAVATGVAAGGSAMCAVLIARALGSTPFARAAAVAGASVFMTAVPQSGYFPPAGAFCALYVDQAIANGAMAKLGLKFALFPCFSGTVFLLIATRVLATFLAQPLRKIVATK